MYKCIYRVVTRRHKSLINDSHFVLKLLQQLRIITSGYEFLWLMQYVKGMNVVYIKIKQTSFNGKNWYLNFIFFMLIS